MKRIENFDQIESYGEDRVEFPKPGGYIGVIRGVSDHEDKEYLELLVDITEGEYKDFYANWYNNTGKWILRGYASYRPTAVKMFKSFTTSVEHSNSGYKWDFDETKLKGKKVGFILKEEEYIKDDNTVGTSLKIHGFRSVDTIRKGNFSVPEKKTVTPPVQVTPVVRPNRDLDDIQF